MLIPISKIQPAPEPIRKTWDKQGMDDLKWSLMEQGQVEPIGVHENGTGYVVVWGHRRLEAARLAGWSEIESVVVAQDEINNLIQAGIENLAGEDMSVDDKVEWAQRLIELGLSQNEISRRSTVNQSTISHWLIVKAQKDAGVRIDPKPFDKRDDGVMKFVNIAQVLGNDTEAKKAIAQKVTEDNLGQALTREIAQAYRDAPTPEVKKKILEVPVMSRDTADDILRRAKFKVELEGGVSDYRETQEWKHERQERNEMDAWDYAVKEFLDMTRTYTELARKGHALIKYGKFSPEAARFTIRKIDALMDTLKNYKEELEQVK